MNTETTLQKDTRRTPEQKQEWRVIAPSVDVFENQDELVVFADLPGVEAADLLVNLEKNQLSFRGKRTKNGHAFDYARTFVVPTGIDADKITAELKHGVLTLRLPKSASLKPRAIEVKAG